MSFGFNVYGLIVSQHANDIQKQFVDAPSPGYGNS
jgi:hypothetical protein